MLQLRNNVLHLTLKVFRLRLSQSLSIMLFKSQSRFSRMFFPTSNLWFLVKTIFLNLSFSYNWKFISTNSFSHIWLLNSLKSTTACRYRHIFSGRALPANLWISVWVLKVVTPGVHSLSAWADANLIFLWIALLHPK